MRREGSRVCLIPNDDFEHHIADTLTAGGELCDRAIVEMVVREAPDRIGELIEWGTQFDKADESDELMLGKEGGHSHRRLFMLWAIRPVRK